MIVHTTSNPRHRGGARRGDRGLGQLALAGLLLPAVAAAAVGGFALQRTLADDDPVVLELPANRYAAPVYACPNDPTVADVHNGDRVFTIGVHEDLDGWLLIRNPTDPSVQWWIAHEYVTTDESVDELPRLGCDDPVPEAGGGDELAAPADSTTTTSTEPDEDDENEDDADESTTTTEAGDDGDPNVPTTTVTTAPNASSTTTPTTTPTTAPTTSPTTAPTTQPPDTTGPQIGGFGRTNAQIRESSGEFCNFGLPLSTTVSASVSDASGLQSVTLHWSYPNSSGQKQMTLENGRWEATLGPFAGGPNAPSNGQFVPINWSVSATDNAGNQTSASAGPNAVVEIQGC